MLRFLKILAWLVAFIVLVLCAITFGGGPYVRSYINSHSSELLGRRVYVDHVSINGFTGKLSIDSLLVAEQDDTTRFIGVRQMQSHLNVPRLFMGTYMLDELDVDGLELNVVQYDTLFNFTDILTRLAFDETDEKPLPLVVKDINIRNSFIHYRDSLVGSRFDLNDITLAIPGIDLRDLNTSVGLRFAFTRGGTLQTHVDYDDRHKTYQMQIKVDDFNMKGLLPYMRQFIWLGDLHGTMNLDLTMRGSLAHLLDFSLKGNAGINGLDVLDGDGASMVRCDTVDLMVRDLDLMANRIALSRVHFDKPYIHIEYGKDSLDNYNRLIRKAERYWAIQDSLRMARLGIDTLLTAGDTLRLKADSLLVADGSNVEFNGHARPLHLVIDHFVVDSARMTYLDESLRYDPFYYELNNVRISAPNFSLDGENHIYAHAQLGDEGQLKFWYDGNTSDRINAHMAVQAEGIDVSDFSPYTIQMFGNEVSRGTMSANLMYDARNGRLIGQNHIIVRNPKVEKKRRGVQAEMNIPFRTGIYFLTDKNDVLDIDLPVKGDIDDPRFSYKRLLFRTMGKFFVKVCTSPFRRNRRNVSAKEILLNDGRELDEISLDSISSDLMHDE